MSFDRRKLWLVMLRAAGPIVGRTQILYYVRDHNTILVLHFDLQRVLLCSLTQRILPTSLGDLDKPRMVL